MSTAKSEPQYRLMVFDSIEEPKVTRDLFCKVTEITSSDALIWLAKAPGPWPRTLSAAQTKQLLDGLYDLGIAAEAWRVDRFPELSPARTIHDAACLPEGFRVKGLRGEPTHWVPWDKVEMLCAGKINADDEYRSVQPPRWPSAVAAGLRALTFRKPEPFNRRARASRVLRDPVGEVLIVRRDPRIAFRIVENKMNYGYLGDRLSTSAAINFPILLADLAARSSDAFLTPSTRALMQKEDPGEFTFETSQGLLDYATHRLLWSWYQRDREQHLDRNRWLDQNETDSD